MEYAEGTDLHNLVQKSGPLPVAQACNYIRQAALGLQHAHERGLVHRDIKPANPQVTAQGTVVKILDLGLARAPEGGDRPGAGLTQAGTIMGTPDYIAPEQIADPRRVDIRADVYSLGCTFYFLLAGRPPIPTGTWEEKLVSHGKVEPQPIEQIRPDVSPAVGAILRKMMAKRLDDRYPTPLAVADALTVFCQMTVALPAPAGSLISQPAAGYEPGWTLEAGSSIVPTATPGTQLPAAVTQGQPALPPPGPTLLAPAPQGLPAGGAGKRPWLLLAGGGGVVGMILLLVLLFWSRGGDKDGKVTGHADGGKGPLYPPPPKGPALADGAPGYLNEKMPYNNAAYGNCTAIFFTPDGKAAVAWCGGFGFAFDLVDYVQRPSPFHVGRGLFGPFALSPDGKHIAACTGPAVALFDGKTYKQDDPPISLFDDATAFTFAPDSRVAVTAEKSGEKGRVRFWDVAERRQLKKPQPIATEAPVLSLAFSLDGRFLATSHGGLAETSKPIDGFVTITDKRIYLYRADDGSLVTSLSGHPKTVSWAAFFADGKRLFSASPFDGTLRVWSVDEADKENFGKEVKQPIQPARSCCTSSRLRARPRLMPPPSPFRRTATTPWGLTTTGMCTSSACRRPARTRRPDRLARRASKGASHPSLAHRANVRRRGPTCPTIPPCSTWRRTNSTPSAAPNRSSSAATKPRTSASSTRPARATTSASSGGTAATTSSLSTPATRPTSTAGPRPGPSRWNTALSSRPGRRASSSCSGRRPRGRSPGPRLPRLRPPRKPGPWRRRPKTWAVPRSPSPP
jgi:WD40 repeat protein